ncbi:uncharacterized protein LOC131435057 isoform X2 [Malaya genurostris]|uniref:uncharacterized protein LOC131435057 isoform X2 n=1 Tax=Malaya genurostris TaxID=325434 RepID=UPI0026F39AA3|nr:uncharacterized protein LOC131435057 isoform X2 [Malaya genurostris]
MRRIADRYYGRDIRFESASQHAVHWYPDGVHRGSNLNTHSQHLMFRRFSEEQNDNSIPSTSKQIHENSNLLKSGDRLTGSAFVKQLFNVSCVRIPSHISSRVVAILVTLYCIVSLALSLTIYYAKQSLYDLEPWALTLTGTLLGLLVILLLLMSIQPRETEDAPFKVPLVPLLPAISIFVNIYLMLMLDVYTWIRFGIWMGIGLPIYLACVCCGSHDDNRNNKHTSGSQNIQPEATSGGIENGGFEPAEETVVTQNGYYSRNLNDAINGLEEKQYNLIPVTGSEKTQIEKQEEIIQMKEKSRTPSPKNSIDEILAIADLSDLIEKIEPNGKSYFVEDVNEKDTDRSIEETSKAIALLDDVLNDEEKTMDSLYLYPSLDDESLASPVFREQSVIADIHREDEISMQQVDDIPSETNPDMNPDNNQAAEMITKEKSEFFTIRPRAAFVVGQDIDSDLDSGEDDEIHYNRLNSQQQKQFMNRLSTLLENPQPNLYKRKTSRHLTSKGIGSPEIQKSNSEPNFVLLLDNSFNNESETDSPSRTPPGTVPPPPKFDEAVFQTLKADSELSKTRTSKIDTIKKKTDTSLSSSVPEAPKFDPILYNTVGKLKSQRPSVLTLTTPSANISGYNDLTLRKLHSKAPCAINNESSETNDEDPSANPREVFKSKLEQILQRGPVNKIRPKSLPPSTLERSSSTALTNGSSNTPSDANTTIANGKVSSSKETSSPNNFQDRVKHFDTATKQQKLIFDDVLKAINPDTRPSVIRNSLEHRMSFSEFKKGLKKTVPPKQYLPNA